MDRDKKAQKAQKGDDAEVQAPVQKAQKTMPSSSAQAQVRVPMKEEQRAECVIPGYKGTTKARCPTGLSGLVEICLACTKQS